MRKAFVLLSGGIDSTTCLYLARTQYDKVAAVSIDYGQRHIKETHMAHATCKRLGIDHHWLSIPGIVPKTMLTDAEASVPNISYDEIKGVSPTYVPFRNGLMLSALCSFIAGEYDAHRRHYTELGRAMPLPAEEWGIYFGAHAEDAQNWAYPDCTPEFKIGRAHV